MKRKCEQCTACCQGALTLEVPTVHFSDGRGCKFLYGDGIRCSIHETRPQECKDFECQWLRDSDDLHDDMRPDKSGVILLQNRYMWNGYCIDLATPVALEAPEQTIAHLFERSKRKQKPLIVNRYVVTEGVKERFIEPFGPTGFAEYVVNSASQGVDFL